MKSLKCAICDQPAYGNHFGAISCRACASFFRRTKTENAKVCKNNRNCKVFDGNGWFQCKKCRLQKCYQAGMSSEKFQFNRDVIKKQEKLPQSIEQFFGRPHFVISCEPEVIKMNLNLIDCKYLVEKGLSILVMGSEKPIHCKNSLQKIALGLKYMKKEHKLENIKTVTKYGKFETMTFWEMDFQRTATFLTYFDEFQHVDLDVQMKILSLVWFIWSKLDKLATTALGRRTNVCGDFLMFSRKSEYMICDMKNTEVDLTWCSRLSNQQMQYFYDTSENNLIYKLAQEMVDLNPTDVELSFMFSHLILYHSGQWFQGEVLEITDNLLNVLTDNLHDYYVHDLNTPRYSARLAQLLRINHKIREDILRGRKRLEIAKIFDVHTASFSHPEVFTDLC